MTSVEMNALLSMVEHIDVALDRYLAGSAKSCETIAHVLDICQKMRAKRLDATTANWLGAVERRVVEIGNARAEDADPSALSKRFVNTQLLYDLHNLRRQLLVIARAPTVRSWLTRIYLRCRAQNGGRSSIERKNNTRGPAWL